MSSPSWNSNSNSVFPSSSSSSSAVMTVKFSYGDSLYRMEVEPSYTSFLECATKIAHASDHGNNIPLAKTMLSLFYKDEEDDEIVLTENSFTNALSVAQSGNKIFRVTIRSNTTSNVTKPSVTANNRNEKVPTVVKVSVSPSVSKNNDKDTTSTGPLPLPGPSSSSSSASSSTSPPLLDESEARQFISRLLKLASKPKIQIALMNVREQLSTTIVPLITRIQMQLFTGTASAAKIIQEIVSTGLLPQALAVFVSALPKKHAERIVNKHLRPMLVRIGVSSDAIDAALIAGGVVTTTTASSSSSSTSNVNNGNSSSSTDTSRSPSPSPHRKHHHGSGAGGKDKKKLHHHGGKHHSHHPQPETSTPSPYEGTGATSSSDANFSSPEGNASTVPIHSTVECDHCGLKPITGTRWKCVVCNNYDLCSACEDVNSSGDTFGSIHDKTHAFLKIATVAQTPTLIAAAINEEKAAHSNEVPKPSGPWRRGGGGMGWGRRGGGGWGGHHPSPPFPFHRHHHQPPHPPHHPPAHPWFGVPGTQPQGPWRWGQGWRQCHNKGSSVPPPQHPSVPSTTTNEPSSTGNNPTGNNPTDAISALFNAAVGNQITQATINGEMIPTTEQEEDRLLDLALKESLAEATVTGTAVAKVVTTPSTPVAVAAHESTPTSTTPMMNVSAPLPFSAKLVTHITSNEHEAASVYPGTKVIKAWRFKNEGNETWPDNCRLVFVGGDLIGAPPNGIEVPSVKPGETIDIAVPFFAPDEPGRYTSNWRMYAPTYDVPNNVTKDGKKKKGVRFGPRVWADIFVERAPSSSSSSDESVPPKDGTTTTNDTHHHNHNSSSSSSSNGGWVEVNVTTPAKGTTTTNGTNGNEDEWDDELAKALAASLQLHQGGGNNATTDGPSNDCPTSSLSSIATVSSSTMNPDEIPVYPEHLATLASMGFDDTILNSQLLVQHKGNMIRVVSALLEAKGISTNTPVKPTKE